MLSLWRSLPAVAVLLAAACASSPRSITAMDLPSSGTWREVTSPHFVLLTDVESQTAREVVARLELYRKLMLIAASEQTDPPHKVNVYLPAASRALSEFPLRVQQALTLDASPWMVMAGADFPPNAKELPNLVAIRYAELLTHSTLGRVPRWFAAGWSVYLQGVWIDEDRGQAVIGYPLRALESYDKDQTWRKQAMPLQALWASEERPPYGWYYVAGYEWAYFLRFRHPDRLASFLDRLATGQEPQVAWSRTFADLPDEELERQTIGFLGPMQQYKYQAVPIPRFPVRTSERAVGPAELIAMRARLELILRGERPLAESRARAIQKLRGGLAAWPADPLLSFELARLDRSGLATEQARALATAHPDDAASHLALALVLLEVPDAAPERLAALEKASRLRPGDAYTAMLLAREYGEAKRATDAWNAAVRAASLAPWSHSVALVQAQAAAAAGRCREAVTLSRRARELSEDLATFEAAQARLTAAQQDCAKVDRPTLAELGL